MTAASPASRDAAASTGSRDSPYKRLGQVIDGLDLAPPRKVWMRERWLDQIYWFDRRAEQANLRHTYLRVIAIGGGVLIPGLVSVHAGSSSLWVWDWVRPLAFVVSLMVAAAVGLDEFFHFGERWRHFRRTAELLKAEGWLFIEGGGRYKQEQHRRNFHELFFPVFATKVEEIIRRDVEVYLTRIVQEKQDDADEEEKEMSRYGEAGDGSGSERENGSSSPGQDPTDAAPASE